VASPTEEVERAKNGIRSDDVNRLSSANAGSTWVLMAGVVVADG